MNVTYLFGDSRFSDDIQKCSFIASQRVRRRSWQTNQSQFTAQAVRLFEGNYSYSVIGKKLGRSKVWVSKWIKALEDESGEIFAKSKSAATF